MSKMKLLVQGLQPHHSISTEWAIDGPQIKGCRGSGARDTAAGRDPSADRREPTPLASNYRRRDVSYVPPARSWPAAIGTAPN